MASSEGIVNSRRMAWGGSRLAYEEVVGLQKKKRKKKKKRKERKMQRVGGGWLAFGHLELAV